MAIGDPAPQWPLKGVEPRFAEWSFGTVRPFGCTDGCTRWHAGIDLTRAPDQTIVVATESMRIVSLDQGWSAGSKAVTGVTATGLFLVYGGTIRGSWAEFGLTSDTTVSKGQAIGRIKGSYGMLHFETYSDPRGARMTNSRWPIGQDPPQGIRNPLNYIQRAAGLPVTLGNWHLRRAALRRLGFYPADGGAWGEIDTDAVVEAQADLGLEADGIWGPDTDEAVRAAIGGIPELHAPTSRYAPGSGMVLFGTGALVLGAYALARRLL